MTLGIYYFSKCHLKQLVSSQNILWVVVREIRNEFHLGRPQCCGIFGWLLLEESIIAFSVLRFKIQLLFFCLVFVVEKLLAFFLDEFVEVSASVSAISFILVTLAFFFYEVLGRNTLIFPRNSSGDFPDCDCFGGGIKLVYIILPIDLFGWINGFPRLCSEHFEGV